MKVNIITNKDKIITDVILSPLNNDLPIYEIENINDIHIGVAKLVKGKIEYNTIQLNKNIQKENYLQEINNYKMLLEQSDYKALKYFEGFITEEDYKPIKEERQSYRDKINELENLIKELEEK